MIKESFNLIGQEHILVKKKERTTKGTSSKSRQEGVWLGVGMSRHITTESDSLRCYLSLVNTPLQKNKYTDVFLPEN